LEVSASPNDLKQLGNERRGLETNLKKKKIEYPEG